VVAALLADACSGGRAGSGAADAGATGTGGAGGGGAADGGTNACLVHAFDGPAYTLAIDGEGRVANLVLGSADYDALALSGDPMGSGWAKVIAGRFQDQLDWYIFQMNQFAAPDAAAVTGVNYPIRSAAAGIGNDLTIPVGFEAQTRLKSVILLERRMDVGRGNLLHELMHTWANHVIPEPSSHWPAASDLHGQLGSLYARGSMRVLGGGRYALALDVSGTVAYADIEQYLMGLVPPSAVRPVQWLRNEQYVERQGSDDIYTGDAMVTTTIDDIITQYGPRVPDHMTAQKQFRGIVVIVSKAPLTAAEWNLYTTQAALFASEPLPHPPRPTTFFSPPNAFVDDSAGDQLTFRAATTGLASIQLSGLLDIRVDPSPGRCVQSLPGAGAGCARLAARATACGLAATPCTVDQDFPADDAACVADCADAAPCSAVLSAGAPGASFLNNSYLDCTLNCQCKPELNCFR
jgi:hypothetical protein